MPHAMNHLTHTYLSVSLADNSPFFFTPGALSSIYPSMEYQGQVGELSDIHLYRIPKEDWSNSGDYIMNHLRGTDGVVHVQVQAPRQRVRRGEEEL